jgi:hypothetical protein
MTRDISIKKCKEAITRLQIFNAENLKRIEDLGQQNLSEVANYADKIIESYKLISIDLVSDFSSQQLEQLTREADTDFEHFKKILELDPRDVLIQAEDIKSAVKNRAEEILGSFMWYIAYCVATINKQKFPLLEQQTREAIDQINSQSIQINEGLQDKASTLIVGLENYRQQAEAALSTIRGVASEQSVQIQAIYFEKEAATQEGLASRWLYRVYGFATMVCIFAVVTLFFYKLDFLSPDSNFEFAQLVTSKVLIFAILGFLLVMSAKNFAAHKHNAVVNRHRQNALLTYRAIVEAVGDVKTRDAVLAEAASCIFAPQETGFTQIRGDGIHTSKSILEVISNSASRNSG